jgi:hypothetical protein
MTAQVDVLLLQQIREWSEAAAADGPAGEVYMPGSWLVEILDERDRMHGALTEIASDNCTYLFHIDEETEAPDPLCVGEVCSAKRGLGLLPPLSEGELE